MPGDQSPLSILTVHECQAVLQQFFFCQLFPCDRIHRLGESIPVTAGFVGRLHHQTSIVRKITSVIKSESKVSSQKQRWRQYPRFPEHDVRVTQSVIFIPSFSE